MTYIPRMGIDLAKHAFQLQSNVINRTTQIWRSRPRMMPTSALCCSDCEALVITDTILCSIDLGIGHGAA